MSTDIKIFVSPENLEKQAEEQIAAIQSSSAFENAAIRIMPDVHAGAGCVIGFTAHGSGDHIIPNVVGVDIGCGMYAVDIGQNPPDPEELDRVICKSVPAGVAVHWARPAYKSDVVDELLDGLACRDGLKDPERVRNSIGTLGGGNHFIEMDRDAQGRSMLIIHSGSRSLGKQVADIWQKQAVRDSGARAQRQEMIRETIARLKEAGRQAEIEQEIEKIPYSMDMSGDDLAYLNEKHSAEYLADMEACVAYARINREAIAHAVCEGLGIEPGCAFHTIHNYIERLADGTCVTRKGAISAKKGERVLIPLNMRDGCIVGTGKGNPDWNESAPHGAGRKWSRAEASRRFSLLQFEEAMDGIYSTSIDYSTIDECPMAYKDADSILERLGETVGIEAVIEPVYNFKAALCRR